MPPRSGKIYAYATNLPSSLPLFQFSYNSVDIKLGHRIAGNSKIGAKFQEQNTSHLLWIHPHCGESPEDVTPGPPPYMDTRNNNYAIGGIIISHLNTNVPLLKND
ncbi:hypothetical protein NA56DRAFT_645198 [Hyaloscypha hepaticicola]|uniref:Uncharacterized protein n=1 Tax=Hyaloscypha hepaticicola TaxID=2082293 RepID=A0A2J6Q6V3_9HELO|nr:hypothetical protein NA56DRAFT_645198 [Hyaloscypha hepaticicola]